MADQRSQLLLDIEHDLSRIKDRLNKIEDHFEDDGVIDQLTKSVYVLATHHDTAHQLLREIVDCHLPLGVDLYARIHRELGDAER